MIRDKLYESFMLLVFSHSLKYKRSLVTNADLSSVMFPATHYKG